MDDLGWHTTGISVRVSFIYHIHCRFVFSLTALTLPLDATFKKLCWWGSGNFNEVLNSFVKKTSMKDICGSEKRLNCKFLITPCEKKNCANTQSPNPVASRNFCKLFYFMNFMNWLHFMNTLNPYFPKLIEISVF